MTQNATLPLPGQGRQADEDAPPPMTNRWCDSHPGVLPRLMPTPGSAPVDLAAHLERFGPPPYRGAPRRLIGDVEAAGLTGRGGAAFPTYRKLAAMTAGRGPAPVVIGNGAEGEPASSKDKSLLWFSPHLVLDGLQLAAEAVGSVTVALYIHRNPRLQARLAAAITQRAAAGLDASGVELIEAPHRFLAGEESALASRASGGPALPRFKPPRASQPGAGGRWGRGAGGPARGPGRPRRGRPGGPLSRAGVGRPVRAVLQRPAAHGGSPGGTGQPVARPAGTRRPAALVGPGGRARRLPSPGRDRPACPQRAGGVRGRDRPPRARVLHQRRRPAVPPPAGRAAARRRGLDMRTMSA